MTAAAVLCISVSAPAEEGAALPDEAQAIENEIAQEEAAKAETAAADAEAVEAETDEDLKKAEDTLPTVSFEDLEELIANMDYDEIRENMEVVSVVLKSEEFHNLMQYKEIQDLAFIALKRALKFVAEEQELTIKILETLGFEEKYAYLLYRFLSAGDETAEELLKFKESKEGQALLRYIEENYDMEELLNLLNQVIVAFDTIYDETGITVEIMTEDMTEDMTEM